MDELTVIDIEALVKKMRQVDTIETYQHFPEVITAGAFRLEPGELNYLLQEGLVQQMRKDSIGKVYSFTAKFKNLLG